MRLSYFCPEHGCVCYSGFLFALCFLFSSPSSFPVTLCVGVLLLLLCAVSSYLLPFSTYIFLLHSVDVLAPFVFYLIQLVSGVRLVFFVFSFIFSRWYYFGCVLVRGTLALRLRTKYHLADCAFVMFSLSYTLHLSTVVMIMRPFFAYSQNHLFMYRGAYMVPLFN